MPDSELYLSNRLVGQDERLNKLSYLFELLQLATVETCDPTLDILTFSEAAYYFCVILKKNFSKPAQKTVKPCSTVSESDCPDEEDLNTKEESSKTFGLVRSVTTQQTAQNLWSDYDKTRSTGLRGDIIHPSDEDDMISEEAIGLAYLVDFASATTDPLHAQELNIGIILHPSHRGNGYAQRVIEMVLEVAFESAKCHRVQAILPDHVAKERAICLFTQMRFDHEGTRRRGFFSPMEHIYKDVTYMGILDTDWILHRKRVQRSGHSAPKSVWDELLSRHQREREELLNWEAGIRYFEANRRRAQTPTQSCFKTIKADDEDDVEMRDDDSSNMASSSTKREPEAQEQMIESRTLPTRDDMENDSSATLSDSESERSASPSGYFSTTSSSGSAWDVVEPSDSDFDSSGSFDSGDEEGTFEVVRANAQST